MSRNYWGGTYDFSDVLFLKQKKPDVLVHDVTGKHAREVISRIEFNISMDLERYEYPREGYVHLTGKEIKKLEAMRERYQAIERKHSYYIPELVYNKLEQDETEIMLILSRTPLKQWGNIDWSAEYHRYYKEHHGNIWGE